MPVIFEMFGLLERLAGARELPLALPAHCRTVADALAVLGQSQPALRDPLERCACAVGDALVLRDAALAPGMRLALLPPVAGG